MRFGGRRPPVVVSSRRCGTTCARPRSPDHDLRTDAITATRGDDGEVGDDAHEQPRAGDRGQPGAPVRERDVTSLAPYVSLRRDGIRRWVVDEAAPHDDVWLLILDRFPRSQDTLASKTAPLSDPLRTFVVEVGDELNPNDPEVPKGPLSDEPERLHGQPTASNSTIKPVERLGSTRSEVELHTDLTSALVRRRHRHRKASQTARPPLKAALDPLPGLILCHRLWHHREPGDVGIAAGLGNRSRIAHPERTKSGLTSGQWRIWRHELTHWDIVVADAGNLRPGFRRPQPYRRSRT